MNSTRYSCQNCGKQLKPNQRPCPFCGCSSIHVVATASASIGLSVRANSMVRKMGEGFKKFKKEIIRGQFPSMNPKLSEGVYKERIVDRDEDEYREVIKDLKTGKTIREIHEPLSQHKHQ